MFYGGLIMKCIKKVNDIVAVYFDKEWDEYVVRIHNRPNSDYRTDDKQDAIDTALHMAEQCDCTPQDMSVGNEYDVDEVIVYADKETETYIVWNQSATFNIWVGNNNVDCFTVYDVDTLDQAIAMAKEAMDETEEYTA
jgi:hypothetical protein